MNKANKKVRRSRKTWIDIMEQYRLSGLTQEQFCKANGLAPGTFCKWRQNLKEKDPERTKIPEAAFIEIPNSAHSSDMQSWDIELELGHGLYLRMRHA